MAKKKDFTDDTDPILAGEGKAHLAQGNTLSLREVDAVTYGGTPVKIPESGRHVSEAIPLMHIHPDPAQPRKAIPASVRRAARRDNIPEWKAWHRIAEGLHGKPIDLPRLLRGEGEAPEGEPLGIPIVEAFLDLVSLASSIYRDKLTNPITVMHVGPNRYQIETGERRFQAHKLLNGVFGDDAHSKIAARIVDKANVWKQATENNARRPLNAIGLARQIALLLMDLYRGKDGISILPYEQIVQDGESDRPFYAQVANGVVYRIPKGMSERILQATGLKSRSRLANYRALLDIPDDVWVQADEEDWTDVQVREHLKPPEPESDMFDPSNISPQNGSGYRTVQEEIPPPPGVPIPPREPQSPYPRTPLNATGGPLRWPLEGEGKRYMWLNGEQVQLESAEMAKGVLSVRAWHLNKDGKRTWAFYTPMSNLKEGPPYGVAQPSPATRIEIGKTYRNVKGNHFKVISLEGDKYRCAQISQVTGQPMPGFWPMSASDLLPLTDEPAKDAQMERAAAAIFGEDEGNQGSTEQPESLDPTPNPTLPGWAMKGLKVQYRGDTVEVLATKWSGIFDSWVITVATRLGPEEVYIGDIRPSLPDWAQPGRMVRDISEDATGKVDSARWSETHQDWYLTVIFMDTKGEVPLAMLEANDSTPILPEWAETGKQVRHKDTGKVGTVVQTALNVNDNEWWLQVDIHQEGIADALLTEFEALDLTPTTEAPAPAAPRERHPALHPSRSNGVIVQEQHLTGLIQEMARRLEMPQNESLVRGMQTLTAQGLKSRMRQSGRAGVEEWLNAIHSAGIAVLGTMAAKLDVIHLNAKQVLDDIEAEQRGE